VPTLAKNGSHPSIHRSTSERLEFYRSTDRGKTWQFYSHLQAFPPFSLSEASVLVLPDGRLLLYAREARGDFPDQLSRRWGLSCLPGLRPSRALGKYHDIPPESGAEIGLAARFLLIAAVLQTRSRVAPVLARKRRARVHTTLDTGQLGHNNSPLRRCALQLS
jgi:hypothetical protein